MIITVSKEFYIASRRFLLRYISTFLNSPMIQKCIRIQSYRTRGSVNCQYLFLREITLGHGRGTLARAAYCICWFILYKLKLNCGGLGDFIVSKNHSTLCISNILAKIHEFTITANNVFQFIHICLS